MTNNRATGFDVSHHDPVLDWSKAVMDPTWPQLVGMKATQGATFVDPKLKEHQAGFRGKPFLLGIYYHFATPGDPVQQARHLAETVGPLQPHERLCLDLETGGPTGAGGATLSFLDAFYGELLGNACGGNVGRPLIYTSKRQWDELVGGLPWDLGSEVDLWVPRYGSKEPEMPEPWRQRKDGGWKIWQNADGTIVKHSIDGVGPCDGNVFNGDVDALRAYANQEA